jgi:hypothetical protein
MGTGMVRLIAALAIWNLGSTLVLAEPWPTADDVLQGYDQADTEGRGAVEAYLHGTSDGLMAANAYLEVTRKQRLLFCAPGKLGMSGIVVISVLRQAIRENPNIGKSPINWAILQSLQDVFPCPK